MARTWQSEDGLPSNVVRALAQSEDGYLWIGTAEGLVRFDGQRFTGFPSASDAALARRSIRALFPLANGEIWVTTSNNDLFRGRGARLEEVRVPASADVSPPVSISQVVLGGDGDVFIVRGSEVWQVEGEMVFVGQGAERWRMEGGKVARLAERSPALEALLQQDAAAQAEQGRAAPGESGVWLRGRGGVLWRFASGEGLTRTDSSGRMEMVALQPDAPAGARAMLEDWEGNLWIGTHSQGLWRLRPSRVDVLTTADGLVDRIALLAFEDREGALWVAPQAGGLDRSSGGEVKHFDVGAGPMRRPISALLETRDGVLWAATRDAQVYSWNGEGFSPPFPSDRGPGKVLSMAEDQQGRIWFGGRYGLSMWESGESRRNIDFGGKEVVTAVVGAGAILWVGTESGRVFRGSEERFEAVAAADSFARQPISSLLPEADGSLWIGTMGGGLFHFREGCATALAPRMREADPRITCVLDDRAGFLWMGTLGGICRAEKAKLLGATPAAGAVLVLDRSDGLLTRECTRGGQPAGWRGRDGTLYFSTGQGVALVHPERMALNTFPPPVVIEEASANGQPFDVSAGRVQCGPGRSRLELRYTALSFTAPQKVRFRTRLEGLDETWRDADGRRTIAYEAVPPGRYEFRVMAENGDGVWNEARAALAVVVLPHFWETRWFQGSFALLVSALAVGIGALVMRARLRERLLRLEVQTSRAKERARIAQDLHDDLGASLTEISLLASLAAEERQSEGDEDNTLPEVAEKAQALVGALDEIVWAVNPRHDTLRSLAEYLTAFGGKFLGRAGMMLRRDVPRDLPEVSLDAERRHNVFLAVREAFNNAVKHSGANEVWLRMRLESGELEVSVEDNGRGFPSETDEFSEGLRGLRERMKGIGGDCRIESDASGTRVRLSLPLASGTRRP